jgi:hypothetical protein
MLKKKKKKEEEEEKEKKEEKKRKEHTFKTQLLNFEKQGFIIPRKKGRKPRQCLLCLMFRFSNLKI